MNAYAVMCAKHTIATSSTASVRPLYPHSADVIVGGEACGKRMATKRVWRRESKGRPIKNSKALDLKLDSTQRLVAKIERLLPSVGRWLSWDQEFADFVLDIPEWKL